jgi:hypothetical protein
MNTLGENYSDINKLAPEGSCFPPGLACFYLYPS